MQRSYARDKGWVLIFLGLTSLFLLIFFLPKIFKDHYSSSASVNVDPVSTTTEEKIVEKIDYPSYVATPDSVRGIYMTSWVASGREFRDALVKLIDETELNTVIIDVKDYSGKIVFPINDNPKLKAFGSEEVRINDLQEFIESLHSKGIYVIARIAVFQDEYFVKHRPDLAVKNKAGTAVWKDRKGISWIDTGSKEYWDYIILLSKEARKIGFDEVNFDYIRFPSDGNMKDISFPFSSTTEKSVVLENFFKYLKSNLNEPGLKTSADLFGMVTGTTDDMGIGQILEKALPHFDYIMPMVYPSHYHKGFQGFSNPAAYPYEVVHQAMNEAVSRAKVASTSPSKIRPWLQDFDLGADYGPAEIRAQVKATYDAGLNSWVLWSPSNKYTRGGLLAE